MEIMERNKMKNPNTEAGRKPVIHRLTQVPQLWLSVSAVWLITLLTFTSSSHAELKVFIMAGQSNMEGHGDIEQGDNPRYTGTLNWVMDNDNGTYAHLRDGNEWSVRQDVWVYYERGNDIGGTLKSGNLSAGFGVSDGTIGPELQFGHVMGDYFTDQVLIIKTAWGGKSVNVDFRPPSSGGEVGPFFTGIVDIVNKVLNDIGTYFPDYDGQGYTVAGFCWHQGWNEGDQPVETYEPNLVNLVKDLRDSLQIPNMPFAIATSGFGGPGVYCCDGWIQNLQANLQPAQLALADVTKYPEFEGNLTAHDTQPYWREIEDSPTEQIYHWNRNAQSYLEIGNGLAEDMKTMVSSGTAGCMDPAAINFDPSATLEDSSCTYAPCCGDPAYAEYEEDCQNPQPDMCINNVGISTGNPESRPMIYQIGSDIMVQTQYAHALVLYSTAGEILYTGQGQGQQRYSFARLKAGLYIIEVTASGGTVRQKVFLH
jgi:hypothetical protein